MRLGALVLPIAFAACATEPPPPTPPPRAPVEPAVEPSATGVDASAPDALDAASDASATSALADAASGPPGDFPKDVPWIDGASVVVEQSTPSVTRLGIAAAGRNAEQVMAAWVDAARAEGFEVRSNPSEGYATLSRAGAKAWISVQSWGDKSFLGRFGRAAHPPAKLPGPCVKIPKRSFSYRVTSMGIDQEGEMHTGDTSWRMDTSHLADVDADGELDAFVPVGPGKGRCPWDLSYTVYVVRGSCGHAVGDVGPGFVAERTADSPPGPSGFRALDFESTWATHGPRGIPRHFTRTTEYLFSNGRYQKLKDDTRGGDCHHCGVSSCFYVP